MTGLGNLVIHKLLSSIRNVYTPQVMLKKPFLKKPDTGFSLLNKKPESLGAKTGFLSLDVAAPANILKMD